ncbi:MAG: UDP-N-acetylglucosamine pyrophosphorylase, partial [Clostridia bacterium]|nr:UDP-N-acetylglucosamine pyrophosphorylase [Clostridia bacterium]
MDRLTAKKLFNLEHTIVKTLLEKYVYPWEVIPKIREFISLLGESLDVREYEKVGECVYIS